MTHSGNSCRKGLGNCKGLRKDNGLEGVINLLRKTVYGAFIVVLEFSEMSSEGWDDRLLGWVSSD